MTRRRLVFLAAPLVTAFTLALFLFAAPSSLPSPASVVRLATTSSSSSAVGIPATQDRLPLWHDFGAIKARTRPVSSQVLATFGLAHLLADKTLPDSLFEDIWLTSAFLDTRPLVVGATPEVALIGAARSELGREGWSYEARSDTPLECHIAVRTRRGDDRFIVTPSLLTPMPDSHGRDKNKVPVIWTCPLWPRGATDDEFDWHGADIFVTLAKPALPPPPSAFVPVTNLPPIPKNHNEGLGHGAVCIQPIVGDTYAYSFPDFLQYYKALGFSDFYAYLLDPGPILLGVIAELVRNPLPGITVHPIRWTLPREWLKSTKPYMVDPRDWGIPGMEILSGEEEAKYAYSGGAPPKLDVDIWAFYQNGAHFDARFESYRAMAASARWTALVDLDEFLLLRPPSGIWPPPEVTSNPFTNWALTVDEEAKTLLPSGFIFRSAFTCSGCQPDTMPPKTKASQALSDEFGSDILRPNPSWPSPFTIAIRHETWFPEYVRTKAIYDPWAFFTGNFHFPNAPYQEYAAKRCEAWFGDAAACDEPYSKLFRGKAQFLPVPPPEVYNNHEEIVTTEYAVGAMYHQRNWWPQAAALAQWEFKAYQEGLDILSDPSSYDQLLAGMRFKKPSWRGVLPEREGPGAIVEDWSLFNTMGGVMVDILRQRKEQPLRRWVNGTHWVGGRDER
ncbi:hypothetical protein MNV49_005918 [Pseudohyphozyma bogoriensis]|nr:hypothetical protein MNV49_005918 [Pseudohyphozyma bogoriensis]